MQAQAGGSKSSTSTAASGTYNQFVPQQKGMSTQKGMQQNFKGDAKGMNPKGKGKSGKNGVMPQPAMNAGPAYYGNQMQQQGGKGMQ